MACVEARLIPAFGIFGLVGLTGHFLVIWTCIKTESLHATCHAIIVNLSASDMLMAATLFPLSLAAKLLGEERCSTVQSIAEVTEYTAFSCTVYNLVLLNIDRYLACLHVLVAIALSWVIAGSISGLCLLEPPTSRVTPFIRERQSTDIYFVTATLLGLVIIIYCQVKLYKASQRYLRDAMKERKRLQGANVACLDLLRQQRKAALVLTAITLVFAFCYLPMVITKMCHFAQIDNEALKKAENFAAPLIILNGTLNPFLYGLTNSLLRGAMMRQLKRILPCICSNNQVQAIENNQANSTEAVENQEVPADNLR